MNNLPNVASKVCQNVSAMGVTDNLSCIHAKCPFIYYHVSKTSWNPIPTSFDQIAEPYLLHSVWIGRRMLAGYQLIMLHMGRIVSLVQELLSHDQSSYVFEIMWGCDGKYSAFLMTKLSVSDSGGSRMFGNNLCIMNDKYKHL